MKEEMFPHPGKILHRRGDQLRQKGSSRRSKKSSATAMWQAEQGEKSTEGQCHLPALPRLRQVSAGVCGGWVLKLGLQPTDPGRGLGLAAWRQPEGAGVWSKLQPRVCAGRSLGPPLKPHC